MKAVIMAGGHGTRIRSIASDIPKPMIPVCGKPVLEYQIENLKECGITEIILVTGYLAESIHSYFGDGSRLGVHISYFREETPLGTAGALFCLREQLQEDFLLLMGDLMISVDFNRFMDFHRKRGGKATLFVHPNSHPYDSDIIVTSECGEAAEFSRELCKGPGARMLPASMEDRRDRVLCVIGKKEERREDYHNQVNAGIYALSPGALSEISPAGPKIDLDREIIRPLIEKGEVYAYKSTEYVKDMGTPDRYEEVTGAVESGLVRRRNLARPQKCIFMDRDGTINVEHGFLKDPERLELLPGAAEAIRKINASPYLAVVITNQPVIARGECSFETLDKIHQRLERILGQEGAYLDGLLYCPHHPDAGFEGEIPDLKFACGCRKPAPGMILEAFDRWHITPEGSWMIGDRTQDILCGLNAGLRTALVETGAAGKDGKYEAVPAFTAPDLLHAVEKILEDGCE